MLSTPLEENPRIKSPNPTEYVKINEAFVCLHDIPPAKKMEILYHLEKISRITNKIRNLQNSCLNLSNPAYPEITWNNKTSVSVISAYHINNDPVGFVELGFRDIQEFYSLADPIRESFLLEGLQMINDSLDAEKITDDVKDYLTSIYNFYGNLKELATNKILANRI